MAVPGPDPPRVGRLEHVEDKAAFVELVGAIIEATEEDAMPDELPKKKLLDPGRAVLWDAHCGEPIGWRKLGELIIAEEWSPDGSVILTDVLTPARAVELYGPVTAITIGPGGGWRSVTYGETTFASRRLDPRGSPYATGVRVVVDDPDREWPCPKCGAAPGEPCKGPRSGKHQERRQWTLYERMQHDNDALRREVKRLDAEVRSLRAWGDNLRKSLEDPSPRCNRPTRAGTACKARAITYPMPIESCQVHLTAEERKALDARSKRGTVSGSKACRAVPGQ